MLLLTQLLALYVLPQMVASQLLSCYYDNNETAPDFPCDPEAAVSACCGPGWICVTNLYCKGSNQISVGTCTERTFDNPACPWSWPDHLNHPLDYRKNFTVCDDGTVCPTSFSGGSDVCCNTHKGRTEINYHNPAALPYASSDLSDYYSSAGFTIPSNGIYKTATTTTAASSSSSSSSSSSASSSPTFSSSYSSSSSSSTINVTSASGSTIVTGRGGLAASPTATPSLSSPRSTPVSSSGLSSSVKAGIGIGIAVALGVLTIAAAIFFFVRRRRRNVGAIAHRKGGGEHKRNRITNGPSSGSHARSVFSNAELPAGSVQEESIPEISAPGTLPHELQTLPCEL